jgi:hypothetical protein
MKYFYILTTQKFENSVQLSVNFSTVEIYTNGNEIWGSHSGEDVQSGLQVCDTVWTSRLGQMSWMNILSLSSVLKLEAVCSCETLVPTYTSIYITTQKTIVGMHRNGLLNGYSDNNRRRKCWRISVLL